MKDKNYHQENLLIKTFDEFVNKLIDAGINITLIQDSKFPITPDSIFPNNWVSFHKKNSFDFHNRFG